MRPDASGRRALTVALVCAALCFGAAARAVAQIDTGAIAGTVVDETGGAMPGVTVTVTNNATGQARTTVTNDLGKYQVTALQPSRYAVRVELSGFAPITRGDIAVNVGSVTDLNVTLRMAAVQESITVTGAAPLVESSKTDLSSVVTQEALESIPSRSRQYLDYTLLMPATSENTSTSAQGTGLNIGGARAAESSLLVDGFYNLDEGFAKVKQRYSEDAIQEFQIISFGGAAEYGRAIGGIINGVTKSGGNTLRGTAYGFMRNENLNAMDWGSRHLGLETKPQFRRQCHQFRVIAAQGNELHAAALELGSEPLQLQQVLGADRAMQAAVEHQQVEGCARRGAEREAPAIRQGQSERGYRLARHQRHRSVHFVCSRSWRARPSNPSVTMS